MSLTLDKATINADGVDIANLAGIPVGAEVFVNDVSAGVEVDGVFQLTSNVPKQFNLRVVLFPYLDGKEVVSAV
jgi:hypothetical protein